MTAKRIRPNVVTLGGGEPRWLLLFHQIPPKPDYLRVRIGRRLRALGAVAIKNAVYVLPALPENYDELLIAARDIVECGGEAVVCQARFVAGLTDDGIEDLFRKSRDEEYAEIARAARELSTVVRQPKPRKKAPQGVLAALNRLRRRFDRVAAKDLFGAREREAAAGLLSLVEDLLQGVEVPAVGTPEVLEPPQGAVWVTRAGVMVDRIASAWLIRRFIDPAARFRFVGVRGYRHVRGELRFDMAGAEFTHSEDRCTFEVLVERFRLHEPGLPPIAQIVHDLDLKDGRFGRPEAAGLDRLIVGIALTSSNDEARLVQGAALFDSLYESFRKHEKRDLTPRVARP